MKKLSPGRRNFLKALALTAAAVCFTNPQFSYPCFAAAANNPSDYATRVIENGTKVNIIIGDIVIPATLNDGMTAKALISRLPFTMKLRKYAHDYCGVMENPLPYDEKDVHYGWLNGDIDFARDGNYFTILYEDEEKSKQYGHQINIGKIDGPLSVIKNMPREIELRIELAK